MGNGGKTWAGSQGLTSFRISSKLPSCSHNVSGSSAASLRPSVLGMGIDEDIWSAALAWALSSKHSCSSANDTRLLVFSGILAALGRVLKTPLFPLPHDRGSSASMWSIPNNWIEFELAFPEDAAG